MCKLKIAANSPRHDGCNSIMLRTKRARINQGQIKADVKPAIDNPLIANQSTISVVAGYNQSMEARS
jgi:hypothetical protein